MAKRAISQTVIDAIRIGDAELDRGARGPSVELDLLRKDGLLVAPLAPGDGGRGWGTSPEGALPMLDALMTLGGASLPIARIYEGHVNALKLVQAFASDEQRRHVASAVHDGRLLGVWGADGSDPVAIGDADGDPRLTGAKAFASGLGDVGIAILTAKTADGLRMILADAGDDARADHEEWDVDAMVGSRSGGFDCAGLPAGTDERLGRPGDLFGEPDFHGGLWRLIACYAGALERIAWLLGDHMEQRGTQPSQLAVARLGQVAMEAQGCAHWARAACLAVEQGEVAAAKAVSVALFAREAVEQSAGRAFVVVERVAGTSAHRRTSEIGRRVRDLRFYLRQADLDGKLALATSAWRTERRLADALSDANEQG